MDYVKNFTYIYDQIYTSIKSSSKQDVCWEIDHLQKGKKVKDRGRED